jgi:hypothetical protein
MNYLLICFALIFPLSSQSLAESGTPPAAELKTLHDASNGLHVFKDLPSLKAWAAESINASGTNPTLDKLQLNGSYTIDHVEFNQIKGIIVRRYKARGVANCLLSVFVDVKNEWVESLRVKELNANSIEYRQQGDLIILTIYNSKKEILRFSLSGLREAE